MRPIDRLIHETWCRVMNSFWTFRINDNGGLDFFNIRKCRHTP